MVGRAGYLVSSEICTISANPGTLESRTMVQESNLVLSVSWYGEKRGLAGEITPLRYLHIGQHRPGLAGYTEYYRGYEACLKYLLLFSS